MSETPSPTPEPLRFHLCTHCGYYAEGGNVAFCPTCGHRLLRECAGCGEPISNPMARYCPHCGARYARR